MPRLLFLIFVLFMALPVMAQSDDTWQFQSIQTLQDLIGDEYNFFYPILSPDGSAIAWDEGGGMCLYTFAYETVDCTLWPENAWMETGRYSWPTWSPDGRTIAYTENAFQYGWDSDIWLLDVATTTFTNMTDDDYVGSIIGREYANQPSDVLPTWNPKTGELYFFRTVRMDDGRRTLQLARLDASGEVELLFDLTDALPTLSVHYPPTFSPDGTQLAFIVLPQVRVSPPTGLWLLSLQDGSLLQVADLEDLRAGLPEWQEGPNVPYNLFWAKDGLLAQTSDWSGSTEVLQHSLYIELPSGEITPIVDFSDVESPADLTSARGEGLSLETDYPLTGTVARDGSVYWFLNLSPVRREAAVYQASLPPSGTPELVTEVDYVSGPGRDAIPTASRDGKLLIYNFLLTFEKP